MRIRRGPGWEACCRLAWARSMTRCTMLGPKLFACQAARKPVCTEGCPSRHFWPCVGCMLRHACPNTGGCASKFIRVSGHISNAQHLAIRLGCAFSVAMPRVNSTPDVLQSAIPDTSQMRQKMVQSRAMQEQDLHGGQRWHSGRRRCQECRLSMA